MLEKEKIVEIIKTASVNIILFIILLLLVDATIFYVRLCREYKHSRYSTYVSHILRRRDAEYNYNVLIKGQEFFGMKLRPPRNVKSPKQPIVIFGCSFAYGAGLNDNQTFDIKLAKYTRRPVYNRSIGGWGTQHMLYQLKSKEFYKLVPEPEYVIYVYIFDHIKRIQILVDPLIGNGEPCILYKNKKGKLYLDNSSMFLLRFPICGYFKQLMYYSTTENYKVNLLKLHILESQKEMHKHWPNTKFIVFVYDEWNPSIEEDLENKGIKIIYLNKLINVDINSKNYTQPDGHPNEKAWDLITPALVKKLNL